MTDTMRRHRYNVEGQYYECPYFTVTRGAKAAMQPLIDAKAPLRLNFMRVLILLDSWSEPMLNFKKVRIDPGDLFIANWGVVVQPGSIVPELTFAGFTMTEEYLHLIYGDKVPRIFAQHNQYMVLHLTDDERNVALNYLSTVIDILKLPRVDAKTVNSIFVSMLNFVHSIYTKAIVVPSGNSLQHKRLSERFLRLVNENGTIHHEVDWYAKQLIVSQHYLSVLVKQETGESPKALIDKHILIRLRVELKYSNKSMAQIADELHFSSVSALGKFFKRHMGITPMEYCKNEQE